MTRTLITGGAGFIGTNMADRLLRRGEEVVILDDLSRAGVEANAAWLQETHPKGLRVEKGDIRDADAVRHALAGVDRVYHFAAQVAVTTSVDQPLLDFDVNLRGTITLLEEIRRRRRPPAVLFTSTNKVYGGMTDVAIERSGDRYQPEDADLRHHGVSEARPLEFCSPYGCSKGGADQYVLDYAKTYGIRAVVFRMSCIYGPHQCGNEDQGWVAHFLMRAMAREPITIYGDGRQVRDVLFVQDLLDAMEVAHERIDDIGGRAFNIGGGVEHTISLLELLRLIGDLEGERPTVHAGAWRIGDQRWYVSDTRGFRAATGWEPQVLPAEGVRRLHLWLRRGQHREQLRGTG